MSQFEDIAAIADALRRGGHETYLVGGAVRDLYLHRPAADLDLATGARPEEIIALLNGVANFLHLVGMDFGTINAVMDSGTYEVTTFRGDQYDGVTRAPVVTYADTIHEDLARRDFTINAMAINLHDTGQRIIDPFDGRRDLADRLLRTPGPPATSFRDDPLRMMRAARFIARFGLTPEDELENTVNVRYNELRRVSSERIRDELMKLLTEFDPTAGLDFLARTGLSDVFLPELNAMRMENDDGNYKDVYTHTLAVVRQAVNRPRVRLAALFHDIAKPATFKRDEGRVSFHHHEVLGATMTRDRLRALKFPTDTVDDVTELVRLHLRVHTADDWTDKAVRRYIRDAGELLEDLNDLQRADVTSKHKARRDRLERKMAVLEERIAHIQFIEGVEPVKPPLDGRQVMEYLGLEPGPEVGAALKFLLDLRLDNGPMTEDEARDALLRRLQDSIELKHD